MTGVRDTAVVILAGGRATRFPRKLEHPVAGTPMLRRVVANAGAIGIAAFVAGSEEFSPQLASDCGLPFLHDRWPGGGPLRALASACAHLPHARIFALAGDEICAGAELYRMLDAAWDVGDEAVVPRLGARLQPLAALYSRRALLREGETLIGSGATAMHDAIARLRVRAIDVPAGYLCNVNVPDDLRRFEASVTV